MARLFLTAAAAIILVAGCNKLQLIESPEQESATLSAYISDYPATKATINYGSNVIGNQKCSIFGNLACSNFGNSPYTIFGNKSAATVRQI